LDGNAYGYAYGVMETTMAPPEEEKEEHGEHHEEHDEEHHEDECEDDERVPLKYSDMEVHLTMMCSECMTLLTEIGEGMKSDKDATCKGPVADLKDEAKCPASEFYTIMNGQEDTGMTKKMYTGMYDCMCHLFPILMSVQMPDESTCDDIAAFEASDCDGDAMSNMDIKQCEGEGEDECTPYTKESMKKQLVEMVKGSGGPDCA
jgi:hypothetical protein